MTTITKERLMTIKQWRETYGPGSNVVLPAEEAEELARIALTALTAEPFGIIDTSGIALINDGSDAYIWPVNSMELGDVPLYIGLPRIALASIPKAMTEEKAYSNVQTSWQDAKYYATGWNACREAMLHGAEPVSQTCKLNELPGNSPVIPDGLSTVCAEAYQVVGVMADALGVFGDAAVQKVLDNLSQQKLVHRDVLPFSLPVTPDGWISCSERMPAQDDWILIYSKHSEYMAGQVQGEYVELSDGTLSWLGNALFWMPLPEPPKEVRQ
ncbi:DUF551 domain-containing protein [Escherichia coli]|nr:DUF551 domain-containing protein [Escherichia coli]EFE9092696.1 DUF551 domain-containing protein [Escherichia coli]EFE9136968.1 DUF551 domain-containing protein [Escherichia coli]EFE9165237.1 DUF551 domain-containing protein [Escherichia coli]EFE9180378.1 DUF551 domain-containing protein [Escherichia coli]